MSQHNLKVAEKVHLSILGRGINHSIEAIAAALDEAEQRGKDSAKPMWSAIDTAPKDGTPILARNTFGDCYTVWWHPIGWIFGNDNFTGNDLTHWMPDPDASEYEVTP